VYVVQQLDFVTKLAASMFEKSGRQTRVIVRFENVVRRERAVDCFVHLQIRFRTVSGLPWHLDLQTNGSKSLRHQVSRFVRHFTEIPSGGMDIQGSRHTTLPARQFVNGHAGPLCPQPDL
jgi:hypothetical protein